MKIAIVGAGAMGSVYAALFAEAGNEVWAIDTWAEHVEAINRDGLRLEGASGDRIVAGVRATDNVGEAGGCDLYVIATKASGVGDAAQAVSAVMPGDALILTIQNGLGAGERIAQFIPTANVLLGVAEGFGASVKGPGYAHHNAMRQIRLGEMDGGMSERLQDIATLWQSAGFNARAYDDIEQLIWEKFVCNVTLSAPCTVFDCTIGEVMAHEDRWQVALGCAREAHRCGIAEGVNFSFDDVDRYVTDFATAMPGASPSMRLDHLARRPSEIDAINGMVPVVGARHGIATPYNETLSAAVRAAEARFTA